MVQIILVLLVTGALAIFALSNLTPVSLVVLGVPVLSLPLSVWILGAIAAGAATTLFTAALFRVAGSYAAARSVRRTATPRVHRAASPSRDDRATADRATARSGSGWSPWKTASPPPVDRSQTAAAASAAAASRQSGDGWERRPLNDWDDWEGDTPPSSAPATDRPPRYRPAGYQPPPDEREPWEEEIRDRPVRSTFEAPQEPTTRRQSGSVYSYSYRDGEPTGDRPPRPPQENVYDAEYRVITPPQRVDGPQDPPTAPPPAPPAPSPSPAPATDEDENWVDGGET